MMKYIWQNQKWPDFSWDSKLLLKPLGEVRFNQGVLLSEIRELGFDIQQAAQADVLVEEALKTSAIEGEALNPETIRSSVARQLNISYAGLTDIRDERADGLVQILLDATINHSQELTPERIFGWHAALFPTGYSGMEKIHVATWRDDRQGPMQIVSGPVGKRKIHFEALPAYMLEKEMQAFFSWINHPSSMDGIIRAGIAHLWFVTIHPFDDGNGRIARTITDMLLAQDENTFKRFYSFSSRIMAERNDYYDVLNAAQIGDLNITSWLTWFLECLNRAILNADSLLEKIMMKSRFWKSFARTNINERQTKVINRLLDAGPNGFEGGLKNNKYMGIAHTSRATAQRELCDLVNKGILVKLSGRGRSTGYDLDWERYRKSGYL